MSRPTRVDLGERAIKYDFVQGFTLRDAEDPTAAVDVLGLHNWPATTTPAATSGTEAQRSAGHLGRAKQIQQDGDVVGLSNEHQGSQDDGQVEAENEEFIALSLDSEEPVGTAEEDTVAAGQDDRAIAVGRGPGYQPPWMDGHESLHSFDSALLKLHSEVITFCRMLEPSREEAEARRQSIQQVTQVVHAIWPSAEVKVFGSYETGLYVPTSDIDMVVMGTGVNNVAQALRALGNALQQRALVRNLQVIASARVPIAKFEMISSGIAFDVSMDVANGPVAAQRVKDLISEWPPMRALVLVLKVFLNQRDLNEVYTGGIGSYALIVMVAAFMALHRSRRPSRSAHGKGGRLESSASGKDLECNLGQLLLDFFRLYGRALNAQDVGISLGGFFRKDSRPGWIVHDRPWLLSVEDPLDATNDVSRNSYNFRVVRAAFDFAYQVLLAPSSSNESLLARIIHLAPVIAGRKLPRWPPPLPPRSLQSNDATPADTEILREGKRATKKQRTAQQADERTVPQARERTVPQACELAGGDGGASKADGVRLQRLIDEPAVAESAGQGDTTGAVPHPAARRRPSSALDDQMDFRADRHEAEHAQRTRQSGSSWPRGSSSESGGSRDDFRPKHRKRSLPRGPAKRSRSRSSRRY